MSLSAGLSIAVIGTGIGLVVGFAIARRLIARGETVTGDEGVEGFSSTDPSAAYVDVVDRLPIGVVFGRRDGSITFRNAMARSLNGTHAGLLLDETLERHLATADAERTSEELLEFYGPPKMVLVVRVSALASGTGFAFIEDISERRRIDSIRTDFVANISHELKTPVGALAVLAETLVDEPDPEVVSRLAGRLLDEAHRASRTIDDLLELSRIELGGERLREMVDAFDVVSVAIERARPIAEPRRIELRTVEARPGRVVVQGDRRQLISAVGNLVENAVKYSDHDTEVAIGVGQNDGWIEFTVTDQGVGIPARDLDRIFERFYRVDKARSRGTGGSGLGLSIVRHVATNHGGTVIVSSREGEGSVFVLRIPALADTGHPRQPHGDEALLVDRQPPDRQTALR